MAGFPYRVQVAGALDVDEALMLASCGVSAVGLPLMLDTHPEDIPPAVAREIVRALAELPPPRPEAVCITYLREPAEILELCRELGARHVQLHGRVTPEIARRLKALDPDLAIIRSLVIRPESQLDDLIEEARAFAPFVAAFLTDTFDPGSGASGATGLTHDWSLSRRLAETLPRPLILAGGLRPSNLARAIESVRPAGVDAHTGLEDSTGRKNRGLAQAFVQTALSLLPKRIDDERLA